MLEVKEVPDKRGFWLSIIFATVMGLLQIAAGIVCAIFAPGPEVAFLIGQGIGDLMWAVEGVITGEASLKAYAMQKVVSLTVDLLTCGLGKAFKAAKGVTKVSKASV